MEPAPPFPLPPPPTRHPTALCGARYPSTRRRCRPTEEEEGGARRRRRRRRRRKGGQGGGARRSRRRKEGQGGGARRSQVGERAAEKANGDPFPRNKYHPVTLFIKFRNQQAAGAQSRARKKKKKLSAYLLHQAQKPGGGRSPGPERLPTGGLRAINSKSKHQCQRWQEASRSGWQIFFTRQIFLAIASQKTASDVAAAEEEGGGGREAFKNHIDTKSYASAH